MASPPASQSDASMTDSWFMSHPLTVPSDWIDYNGHMNMAYYNRVCDLGLEDLFNHLELGEDYRNRRNLSFFTAEFHTRFLREARLGETLVVATRLLDHDEKRLHFFHEVRHASEGWIAATGECLCLHVDMSGPKVAPMPPDVAQRLDEFARLQPPYAVELPIGAQIGLRRR